jgi:hypothetical protein
MMRLCVRVLFLACLAAAVSCGAPAEPLKLKELQQAHSGDLDVVLLAAGEALKPGKDQAFLEFRSGTDHHLVDVGTVTVNATMPMAGMPPMMGSSFVNKTDAAGRYAIDTDLGMVGSWRLEIAWDGPAGKGKVMMPGTVR